ncbi:conjugal transfer protein TraW [Novosphingobium sp. PY1]|uniref:conjugal transfer protein TraW n=1 Tax=Novosphingobium sp. PY1 TaxID=1882221 RepID=UPI001A8D8B93|nr:conjugal transfer protein TraW [Novosphingobium sp. PY1]GFM31014.1 plasmid transfer protein TraW [Novosphingobium sp. PY1]
MHPTRHNRARAVAIFQAVTVATLVLASALLGASADAATSTIGRTWPIAEPDALSEIEARSARLPADMRAQFGPRSTWTAMKAAVLAPAKVRRTRSVVPFYTLDTEIRLPGGEVLYPRGYTFNPLDYVTLPQRLVVVRPRDLDWALRTAGLTDFILLTAGDAQDSDAITLSQRWGRPIFILEERVKQRLGLTVAPVVVRQQGRKLELTEVRLDRRGTREAATAKPASERRAQP